MGRILVLDDDDSTTEAMAMLLRDDGHEVESFTSGPEAVAALRSGRAFDVVVTEFRGPVVDGAAVTKAARDVLPNACIVVTHQGRAHPSDLQHLGACVVLEKPIHYDAMLAAITACLARGGHAGPQCARRSAEALIQLKGR